MQPKIMVIWDDPSNINPEYLHRLDRSDETIFSQYGDPGVTMGMMMEIMPSTEASYCRIWEIGIPYRTIIMAILLQFINLRVSS